ncbi:MAG: ROK family protein [Aeoliella sp.]
MIATAQPGSLYSVASNRIPAHVVKDALMPLLSLQDAQPPFFAGIDVGGTNIKMGIVDDSGQPVAFTKIPTQEADGPNRAAERMAETIATMQSEIGLAPGDVAHIGLATPGPLDLNTGMLLTPGNLPHWHETPIREVVSAACDRPVTYANDANAAAFGEFWAGTGQSVENMLLLTLGTGVGGGIISSGKLIEGPHGCGGECGHIIINSDDDAPLNTLGIRGTLEGYVGAYGVVARANAALADGTSDSQLGPLAGTDELTPLAIAQAAEAGDELALGIIMETAKYLAIGIASIIHTVDPESVVLGGAMTFGGTGHPLGEKFLNEVRTQAKLRMIESLRDQITIDFAKLKGDAGYIGAAGLARGR